MAETKKLITHEFKVHNATKFVDSFSGEANNNYYIYASRHIPYSTGDTTVPSVTNSIVDTYVDVYNNMVFAKRVLSTDVIHMIPRYNWTSGTIYSEYTHLTDSYLTEQFFVVVDELTEYNVYKCLFNNGDSPSLVAPSRVGSAADLDVIITGDGYYWKYMFTITKSNFNKFASTDYVPLTPNNSVIENAVPGSVEVIKIADSGAGYDNYVANAQFRAGDVKYNTSTVTYRITSEASSSDDFYKGCVLRITTGAAAEQYRKIVSYSGVGSDKLVIVDSPFSDDPAEGDNYEIYPYLYVWGDGTETTPADAVAVIDPNASNSVASIEILSVGKGYRSGFIIPGSFPNLSTNSSVNMSTVLTGDPKFKEANVYPVISPPGGHGSNPYVELIGKYVCISSKFTGSESGTIPTQNDFRQVGLIKDPLFNNVDLLLETSNTVGSFSVGETVYQFKQIILNGNVSIISGNNEIIKANQGVISSSVNILNAGTRYDDLANNSLVFNNTGTGGSGAAATFAVNNTFVQTVNFRANNAVGVSVANFISIASNPYLDGQRVRYYIDSPGTVISGLSNNENYFVISSNSTGLKLSSTLNGSELAISNSSSTGNSNLSVVNGAIISVTMTNQGTGYILAPSATVNGTAGAGASNAQFSFSLANPEITAFGDAFDIGDYVLVSESGLNNFLSTVTSIENDYKLIAASNSGFSSTAAKISAIKLSASGVVKTISTGQITVSNVSGIFSSGKKIIGIESGATGLIRDTNGVEINDKSDTDFLTAIQLSRLVGNIGSSEAGFVEDEIIRQDYPIENAQPYGYVHHVDLNSGINDDVVYISNQFGKFNTSASALRDITGDTSGATLTDLVTKYDGDFVPGSGRVLYYENVQPITRSGNKSEIVKIILEF